MTPSAMPHATVRRLFKMAVLAVVLLPLLYAPQICSASGPGQKPGDNTAAAFIAAQKALGRKPNRLIHEKSPYLLKHAFNPVTGIPVHRVKAPIS